MSKQSAQASRAAEPSFEKALAELESIVAQHGRRRAVARAVARGAQARPRTAQALPASGSRPRSSRSRCSKAKC